MLASLIGVGVVAGCGGEASWEHPNRQRYAAPPEQTDDTMSIEELQRVWKQQDQQRVQKQVQRQAANAQSIKRNVLEMAMEYLTGALGAAVNHAGGDPTTTDEQKALGGGPPPGATPPAEDGSGDM
jgi:hypothetical protein